MVLARERLQILPILVLLDDLLDLLIDVRAEIRHHGEDVDDAREHVEHVAHLHVFRRREQHMHRLDDLRIPLVHNLHVIIVRRLRVVAARLVEVGDGAREPSELGLVRALIRLPVEQTTEDLVKETAEVGRLGVERARGLAAGVPTRGIEASSQELQAGEAKGAPASRCTRRCSSAGRSSARY